MKFRIAVILVIAVLLNSSPILADKSNVSIQIEMLPWDKVNKILPKYSKFIVMDVETGEKFHVQRRAGSNHADVQPLTSKDTKIMKKVYDGKWSWKRRAIIVINGNQWIAASMHGMPHGAGALKNNFPGHFCIHFYGSATHRTNFMDLSHKLMILKSAGKLQEYINQADPYEVIRAFFAGMKQQDIRIVSAVSLQKIEWKNHLKYVENINLSRMLVMPIEDLTEDLSLEIPVEVDMVIKNSGRRSFKGKVYLVRFSPYDAWEIDSIQFLEDSKLLFISNKKA
ncbi:hypothetical protein LIS82_17285 [Cytobacillus solani]|uniref:Uncharacterized protein n=1 Tax=Cytobacillus solani TaxID=1637975 RepID=A0A0Q3QR91_9BACI|nr:hypothetical protein [Cytobacillus solani]KQL20104.1 hypothetical protein AN957_17030 [Cytobacillus solani]USK53352.1 hypothetical protein LIS82_17285 [Cytobacillus solani]